MGLYFVLNFQIISECKPPNFILEVPIEYIPSKAPNTETAEISLNVDETAIMSHLDLQCLSSR